MHLVRRLWYGESRLIVIRGEIREKMSEANKKIKIEKILFNVLWLGYLFITLILFYNQAASTQGRLGTFHTDMVDYLEFLFAGERDRYTYAYPIVFNLIVFFSKFTTPAAAAAFAVTLINCLTPIIIKYYLDQFVGKDKGILNCFLTFILLFVTPIFFGVINCNMYLGVWSPNTWHNAPILATKGISIIAFFSFFTLLQTYKTKIEKKDFFLFTVSMLLSVLAKPTFAFVFFPTVGLYLLYELIASKFKIIKRSLLFFVAFVPSFIALLYQYWIMFDESGNNKIVFGLGTVWHLLVNNLPFAILCGLAFPLFVAVFNYKYFSKSVIYRITGFFVIVSIAEAYFISEAGDRMLHGNFMWGYCHALFFAFLISLILFVRTFRQKNMFYRIGGTLLISAHLISGIIWFIYQFLGRPYNNIVLSLLG